MDKNNFVKQCVKRGICHADMARKYTKRFPKEHEYTEEDFENAFRFEDHITSSYASRGLHRYEGCMCTKHFKKY